MVSAYLTDALRDPTGELKELYASLTSDNFAAEVFGHFSRVFDSDEAFKQIPVLSLHNPPEAHADRALVRFRGMVQDPSTGPEVYLERTKSGSLCGWGIEAETEDSVHSDVDVDNLRECHSLWAISIPGESPWVTEELDGSYSSSSSHRPVRPHKSPQKDTPYLGVQIKLYNGEQVEVMRSTTIATFIGVLTRDWVAQESEEPLSVPTLHVLYFVLDKHGLVSRPYPLDPATIPPTKPSSTIQVRQELIEWLAQETLSGDLEAAEWLLLVVLSKVQSRHPPLFQPSLTLSNFPLPLLSPSNPNPPRSSIPSLSYVLSLLLPLTQTLSLSIDMLNGTPFDPTSIDNDLRAGALQLPQGTLLLVTEHGVEEGRLVEQGVLNIRSLQEVMTSQTLGYSFPFSRYSFPTDITCIVTTDGSKSAFFKTDIIVPLQPSPASAAGDSKLYRSKEAIQLPPPEKLAAFRNLIVGARSGKVAVNEATSEYIQQDFVHDRQSNNLITSDDLIRQMAIAKLYSLSCHKSELTPEIWDHAKSLDEKRLARLS